MLFRRLITETHQSPLKIRGKTVDEPYDLHQIILLAVQGDRSRGIRGFRHGCDEFRRHVQ